MSYSRPPSPIAVLFAVLVLLVACSTAPQQPAAAPDTRAADEATIRAADAEWVKAVAAKDVAQSTSY
jgi:hypothetical protein